MNQLVRVHDSVRTNKEMPVSSFAEDTFLLLDALEADVNELGALKPLICLEIGCAPTVPKLLMNEPLAKIWLGMRVEFRRKHTGAIHHS